MSMDRILSCFPLAWRARYEAEVRDLLESRPFGRQERADLIRACADAWMRQCAGRALSHLRFLSSIGVRVGVVLGAGWICVAGIGRIDPLVGVSTWSAGWAHLAATMAGSIALLKIFSLMAIGRFVVLPYVRIGSDLHRPPVWQVLVGILWLTVLQLVDSRPPHLGDLMFFGMVATMRHARWLGFYDRPSWHLPPPVLGLR